MTTGADTWCVLADKCTVKVNNIMKKKSYDVVKTDWLLRCTRQEKLLSW